MTASIIQKPMNALITIIDKEDQEMEAVTVYEEEQNEIKTDDIMRILNGPEACARREESRRKNVRKQRIRSIVRDAGFVICGLAGGAVINLLVSLF